MNYVIISDQLLFLSCILVCDCLFTCFFLCLTWKCHQGCQMHNSDQVKANNFSRKYYRLHFNI